MNVYHRLIHGLVYVIFRFLEFFLQLLPLKWIWLMGSLFGKAIPWILPKYRKIVDRNLRIAYGQELSAPELKKLRRQFFSHLVANAFCGLVFPRLAEDKILRYLEVEGHSLLPHDSGAVFAVLHSSCWELLIQVPSIFPPNSKIGSIYQSIRNPYLNAYIHKSRARLGSTLFDRAQGFTAPIKFANEGNMLGVLADQHAGDHGVWMPFFGRLASTTNLPALISIRNRLPLFLISVSTLGPARWKLTFTPGPLASSGKDAVNELTRRLNLQIESQIRTSPQDWFWVHNRWKTPNPNFLLTQYKRGIHLAPESVFETQSSLKPFEILMRSPNWLGDACMAVPTVRAFKKGRPDARVTILTPEKLRPLWEALPEVDAIISKADKASPSEVKRSIEATGLDYNVAVLLPNSLRSAREVSTPAVHRRVGYAGHSRTWWLDQIIKEKKHLGPPQHHALRYLHLAKVCGANIHDKSLMGTGNDATSAQGKIQIALCAGAEYGPAKRWPVDRYAEVANTLSQQIPSIEWVLVGAPKETALGEELSSKIHVPHQNLVGKTRLEELICILKNSHLLLTNDTGTMHLAGLIGLPTVSIFGSTEPSLTSPIGHHHLILRHHVECSPCFLRECPIDFRCMTSITPSDVVEAVLSQLKKNVIQIPLPSQL